MLKLAGGSLTLAGPFGNAASITVAVTGGTGTYVGSSGTATYVDHGSKPGEWTIALR